MGSIDPSRHQLLLLYKDDLPIPAGHGFPFVAISPSIATHFEKRRPTLGNPGEAATALDSSQPLLLFPELAVMRIQRPLHNVEVPVGCSVWGWWRKPWEYHTRLFSDLEQVCREGRHPRVLLYNQYLTQLYSAVVHGVYHVPWLTTVVVPDNWREWCPDRYGDSHRLCGAFLLIQFDTDQQGYPRPLDPHVIGSLFVDSDSFELSPDGQAMVIHCPSGIRTVCNEMIDRAPSRVALRSCEHTILLLRSFKQREKTKTLLDSWTPGMDADLAGSFMETEWDDIRAILKAASPTAWARLATSEEALAAIGSRAANANSHVTRFDFELLGRACSNARVRPLLWQEEGGVQKFTPLGTALVQWGTAASLEEAVLAAVQVFRAAWNTARDRYGLGELKGYFENLPALEAVASAARHGIGRKFYRDHLSHNVRSALLATHLTSTPMLRAEPHGINASIVALFAGLFHDISFPVSAFPETIATLASGLTAINLCSQSLRPQSLIDTDRLRKSLNYVASLAAVPSLDSAFAEHQFNMWSSPGPSLDPADKRLIHELLLCAHCEEHAIVSAAVIFNQAVLSRCGNDEQRFDIGLRQFMADATGPNAKDTARELLMILQSIALHDRKGALKFHGVSSTPLDSPCALSMEQYCLPCLVSIADELQEWGRPIGAYDSIATTDGQLILDGNVIHNTLTLSSDGTTFASVPFSLLEAMLAKVRTLGKCVTPEGKAAFQLDIALVNLKSFCLFDILSEGFRIGFSNGVVKMEAAAWPQVVDATPLVPAGAGERLIGIGLCEATGRAFDYVVVDGDPAVCKEFAAAAGRRECLSHLAVSGSTLMIGTDAGTEFRGQIVEYRIGKTRRDQCIPNNQFPDEEACAVLHLRLVPRDQPRAISTHSRVPPQSTPEPHFLDYDWRFTERTARWLVSAAREHARGRRICYLGCPTLAMWHSLMFSGDTHWLLLDRGHHALDCWKKDSDVLTASHRSYDVDAPLDGDLVRQFSIVILDPPWYDSEYRAFCRRASQLASDDGMVFVTNYPPSPPYDADKHKRLTQMIIEELRAPWWLGSTEIDYEVPPFEGSWQGQKQFEHPGLGIYRLGYMDAYRVRGGPLSAELGGQVTVKPLSGVYDLGAGHYLRHTTDNVFPCSVRVARRKTLSRMLPAGLRSVVAWSTRNAVVEIAAGGVQVNSIEDVSRLVMDWERGEADTTAR